MARVSLRIVGPALLTNAAATKYTVPAATKIIVRQFHLENPTSSIVTFTCSIGADAAGTRLFDAYPIPAITDQVTKGIVDLYCQYPMEVAEILQAFAGTTNVMTLTVVADVYTLG